MTDLEKFGSTENLPEDFPAVLSAVRTALGAFRGQLTGAQAHKIMVSSVPGLNVRSIVGMPTGPGALTKFVETYLGDLLRRVGNQGGDVLYTISEDSSGLLNAPDDSIWKAFVSPNGQNHLYVRTSPIDLFVSKSSIGDMNSHKIEKITDTEHQAVRDRFVREIASDDGVFEELKVVQSSSYEEFLKVLRTHSLAKRWGLFRRDAFRDIFVDRLGRLPGLEGEQSNLVEKLLFSQEVAHRTADKQTERSPSGSTPVAFAVTDKPALDVARALAHSAIENLSYGELRAIHLPLGAVLDALSASK